MMKKSMITLTAAVIVGVASSALSYEDPENRIGDRYPFLEPFSAPMRAAAAPVRMRAVLPAPMVAVYEIEDVENRIADRYPFLEPGIPPARVAAGRYLGSRLAASVSRDYPRIEDPENRIADRYPFLEERVAPSRTAGRVASRRTLTTGSIR